MAAPVTADAILSLRNNPPREPYTIPGVGIVQVYGLSNLEARQWNEGCERTDGRITDPYADAKMIVRCVRNDKGERIFTDKHVTQIVELPELVVKGLIGKCMKLCGIGPEADAEILKNFAAAVASS